MTTSLSLPTTVQRVNPVAAVPAPVALYKGRNGTLHRQNFVPGGAMRRSVLRSLGAAAVLISAAQETRAQLAEEIVDQIKAGVPVVGVDVGASIPIGNFQETAKPGGAIAPSVGYQIGDGSFNGLTFTPILQPQFAGFQSCCGDSVANMTSLSAGARFSLIDASPRPTSARRAATIG